MESVLPQHGSQPKQVSGTLRENVVMGRPWDAARFERALADSQLTEDVRKLVYGAATHVGGAVQ